MTKKISIFGSTGSIGVSTLDVIARHPQRFSVSALSAGNNLDLLFLQIQQFHPRVVCVATEEGARNLFKKTKAAGIIIEILFGDRGLIQMAQMEDVDLVVSAIVGSAGLLPTLFSLRAGKNVALANKESLVIAGSLMIEEARAHQAKLIPIDSEHSALFQCLQGNHRRDLKKIILTASGGPFLNKSADQLKKVTRREALNHPNWSMGEKITIDSATLMNKGLEVMEAAHLFQAPLDQIEVVVHPQSIVHSMISYKDGSIMAQMGSPDMRAPIAYALSYPDRIESGAPDLNVAALGNLSFMAPDYERFPSLKLCFEVAKQGGSFPAVLNGANEVTVAAFLKEQIGYLDIYRINAEVVSRHVRSELTSLEDVLEADRTAREWASELIRNQ